MTLHHVARKHHTVWIWRYTVSVVGLATATNGWKLLSDCSAERLTQGVALLSCSNACSASTFWIVTVAKNHKVGVTNVGQILSVKASLDRLIQWLFFLKPSLASLTCKYPINLAVLGDGHRVCLIAWINLICAALYHLWLGLTSHAVRDCHIKVYFY